MSFKGVFWVSAQELIQWSENSSVELKAHICIQTLGKFGSRKKFGWE